LARLPVLLISRKALTLALEPLLALLALILTISIAASKLAARSGVPALLLFLALGMALGSEGVGGIAFDDPQLTQSIGVVALIFILFSGGLDTRWRDVRPVLVVSTVLATLGVAVTALVIGVFAHWAFGFDLASGVMLGAIVGSTDAAAVIGVLRGRGVRLLPRLKPILELESSANDPMAILLSVGMIRLLTVPETGALDLLLLLVMQMGIGFIGGVLVGRGALWSLNRLRLEYDGLYPVVTITTVLMSYSLTSLLGGSGFLAVYITGVVLARNDFIHKTSLSNFHDGLAWLMQIAMFLTLGLQVFPSELAGVTGEGLLTAVVLMVLARPLSVWVSTLRCRVNWRERLFIGWVGLRGASPIVLATFPLLAGIQTPIPIFDLVFFVVVVSVAVQGTTLPFVARLLRVEDSAPERMTSLMKQVRMGKGFGEHLMELTIPPTADAVGRQILDLKLPPGTLIVMIMRDNEMVAPKGSTVIQAGDDLLLTVEPAHRTLVRASLTSAQFRHIAPDAPTQFTP
jgi:cell volume regulation protein A